MEDLEKWYTMAEETGNDSQMSIANQTFRKASVKFLSGNKQHEKKLNSISEGTGSKDVLLIVTECMNKYEARRKHSEARTCLHAFAQRVSFYGNILDVFVQHHPEYVSLAWGAMKFLFVGVINHEKTVTTLAQALSDIADMLPQVKLSSALYPTQYMRTALDELYASIMEFMMRAYDWYEEGTLKHIIHSVTRPVELRYADILQRIARCSQRIQNLASVGQQAEVRDLHIGLDAKLHSMSSRFDERFDDMNAVVEEIKSAMTLQSAAMINTNYLLTDIQFSQIMASITDLLLWDPAKMFQYHRSLRDRRSHNSHQSLSTRFWTSSKLFGWFKSGTSDLLIVRGSPQARFSLRNFCVDVIEQLRSSHLPVLFALKVSQGVTEDTPSISVSWADVLKYLLRQALQETHGKQTEKSMSLSCARVHSARSDLEWFQNLEAALSAFEKQVYIVIDLEILDRNLEESNGFSWLPSFLSLFGKLAERRSTTRIKVLLITYGHEICSPMSSNEQSKFMIQARTDIVTVRQQKLRRHMPQRGIPDYLRREMC
ncbi:hypothetical protein F5B22DRAFT_592503 [Xylaria bambusicola]|uniref:uncharacterized protein n=1 Tax=Xylaria bambusicola TaxID=326684 RepID=UPI00200855B1|nr:uncharacterized protein F5B22DRAFT_592503 [Xylaria bambusicola]KAI0523917.1 hypothetical protein F5B22DRAFT_592503 [Xylaria bambusicola]